MKRKYYSTQRPVAPGTYPKKGVIEIVNFDRRTWIEKDHVSAWGYIIYDRALKKNELDDYELAEA